jgi:preprotein translocase subunit SecG
VIIGTSIVLIITSSLMVLLVLLHKGKGGGLSDLFGGGISSSLGGSSVVERNLDRLTIGTGVIWFASIIALGLLFAHGHHGCDATQAYGSIDGRRAPIAAAGIARSSPWVVATPFGVAVSVLARWERPSAVKRRRACG